MYLSSVLTLLFHTFFVVFTDSTKEADLTRTKAGGDRIPHRISNDLYKDPCKAGEYVYSRVCPSVSQSLFLICISET